MIASNGGIVWSDASQLQILAGVGTANNILLSGASNTLHGLHTPCRHHSLVLVEMYTSAASTVNNLSSGSAGMYLRSGGAGAPSWQKIDLSSSNEVNNTLPVANGGTGQSTYIDGQLLIGNSTGNTLSKSTLTAGTLMTVTNAPGTITISANVANVVVATDVLTTSNLANIVTGMVFNIGAGETWSFEFNLQIGCNSTGGVKWAIVNPAGAIMNAVATGNLTTDASITSSILTSSGTLSANTFCTQNTSAGWTRITGVVVNGSSAGSVQLEFASPDNVSQCTVYANSYLTARRVN